MAEPFVVVAVLHPHPGKAQQVLDGFREVSPLVYGEQGCELYAAHLTQDGEKVYMIERWLTGADLDAHATGAAIARLNELQSGLLAAPTEVVRIDAVPIGDDPRGILD